MRIVVAPDSFKESLSARGVAQAIASGIHDVLPDAQVQCIPMADGGEGSLDAVLSSTGGQRRSQPVHNANGQEITASWALLPDNVAFIEMAEAAGLQQIPRTQRNPLTAGTYGVGQLILAALDAGAQKIVIGLGGSATNDAGAGVFQALGGKLLDAHGTPLPAGGAALASLASIDTSHLDTRLASVSFELAVDVDNPLCGERGASAIFGPQKGATPDMVAQLDAALAHFASVCKRHTANDQQSLPGMGAAGGLGFAIKTFFNATFRPGVELIAELSGLAQALEGADLVFTGEGRMDSQTLLGKTPAGVARQAQQRGIPVIALAGSLGEGYQQLYQTGITTAFSLVPGPGSLDDACSNAPRYLRERAADCMRLWQVAQAASTKSAQRKAESC